METRMLISMKQRDGILKTVKRYIRIDKSLYVYRLLAEQF